MKIMLVKKWDWVRKTFPIGQILEVAPGLGAKLIESKTAELYTGQYPPKKKTKTNFFNPNKIKEENGKS
jgi:hypothetical protein